MDKKYSYCITLMEYVCFIFYLYILLEITVVPIIIMNGKRIKTFWLIVLLMMCIWLMVKLYKTVLLKKYGNILEACVYEESLHNIFNPVLFSPIKAARINLRGKVKTSHGYLPIKGTVKLGVYQSFLYSEILNLKDDIKVPQLKVLMDTKHYKIYRIYAYDFLKELYEVNIGENEKTFI